MLNKVQNLEADNYRLSDASVLSKVEIRSAQAENVDSSTIDCTTIKIAVLNEFYIKPTQCLTCVVIPINYACTITKIERIF